MIHRDIDKYTTTRHKYSMLAFDLYSREFRDSRDKYLVTIMVYELRYKS